MISYINPTTISYELTIDDPKTFTKPFLQTWEMHLKPDWESDPMSTMTDYFITLPVGHRVVGQGHWTSLIGRKSDFL